MSSLGHGKVLWVNDMGTLGDYLLKQVNREICQIRTKRVEEAIKIMQAQKFPNKNKGIDVPDFSKKEKEKEIIKQTAQDLIFKATCRNDYWYLQDNCMKVMLGIPIE